MQYAQALFAADDGPTSYAPARTSPPDGSALPSIASGRLEATPCAVALSSGMAAPLGNSRHPMPVITAAPLLPLSAQALHNSRQPLSGSAMLPPVSAPEQTVAVRRQLPRTLATCSPLSLSHQAVTSSRQLSSTLGTSLQPMPAARVLAGRSPALPPPTDQAGLPVRKWPGRWGTVTKSLRCAGHTCPVCGTGLR